MNIISKDVIWLFEGINSRAKVKVEEGKEDQAVSYNFKYGG